MQCLETFKGLPVLKESKANLVSLPPIIIKEGMERYSGWDYVDHVKWVRELTGLDIPFGLILAVDDYCTEVWILSSDYYKTTVRLIYKE